MARPGSSYRGARRNLARSRTPSILPLWRQASSKKLREYMKGLREMLVGFVSREAKPGEGEKAFAGAKKPSFAL